VIVSAGIYSVLLVVFGVLGREDLLFLRRAWQQVESG
jgi:hypothetical protein